MRQLLHFGLFVLALTAVTRADAQDKRRVDRHTTVVISPGGGPRYVQPVRASFDAPRAVYDSRRTFPEYSRATYYARRAYFDQQQDLQQIVTIANRWERATASGDRHAQWKVDQRLDAWLAREIHESSREHHSHRYAQRVRLLRDELALLERRLYDGRGHHGHGHQGRGHGGHGYQGRGHHGHGYQGRGHGGRGRHGYYTKKARILGELVELSERQLERARANIGYPLRPSFAYR
jgi:hypothetical protein